MGQKTHPVGFRLGVVRGWSSKWYSEKDFSKWLHEDLRLKKFVKQKLNHAGVSAVEVERAANKVKINIFTARPGIVIGKRGAGVETLKKEVQALTSNEVFLNIQEVRKAETNAQLVAENVATQLERRVAFRRAMKKSVQTAMKFGAKGIRLACSGRLGGAEMARYEWYHEGRVPLHTLRADIEYGTTEAHTTYGAIGVKCWIFKGEVLPAARTAAGLRKGTIRTCSLPRKSSGASSRRGRCAASPRARPRSSFGEFGLQALSCGFVTSRQIEAARIAISRHVKRGGKLYIRIFPDKPISKKPAETRMGHGKGNPEEWVAVVRPGRVMYELEGVDETLARAGVPPGRAQAVGPDALPVAGGAAVKGVRAKDLRGNDPDELRSTVRKLEEDLFKHRLKKNTNQLENTMLIRNTRRDIARVNTVLAERVARRRRRASGAGGRDGRGAGGRAERSPSARRRSQRPRNRRPNVAGHKIHKRRMIGVVTSDKMNKTRVVLVERRVAARASTAST